MLFLCSVAIVLLLTTPGIYLILRSRLAASVLEAVASGFFLGFGLVVLAYLGLSGFAPVRINDAIVIAVAFTCLVLVHMELKRQRLPIWVAPLKSFPTVLIGIALAFLIALAIGDLSTYIDDDIFIHLPNVKRIEMGDVPPHLPYFPQFHLRGHIARDLFTGTIGRMLALEPELSIIYVTLAVCPAYVLMFYYLALRLASGNLLVSSYGFFGLVCLVSLAVGPTSIQAGPLTYVFNNNIFAYGHAAFIAWLIVRAVHVFKWSDDARLFMSLRRNWLVVLVCILAYAAVYFVYVSNFLMFSVFLCALPLLMLVFAPTRRLKYFVNTSIVVVTVGLGCFFVDACVSPFVLERIRISLGLYRPDAPMGLIQQARLTFPKDHLLTITDQTGADVKFLRGSSLIRQGLSFYIGLAGLLLGVIIRNPYLSGTSLFGWLTLLWLMFVDMGEFRGETLRLMFIAHVAFGGCSGLTIGLAVDRVLEKFRTSAPLQNRLARMINTSQHAAVHLCSIAVVTISVLFLAWIGRGNVEKFVTAGHWHIFTSVRKLALIHAKNPESWNVLLNLRRVDYAIFQLLASAVKDPSEKLLLNVQPDPKFDQNGNLTCKLALLINAVATTGVGITGVCQEHGGPLGMGKPIIPQDYRTSLFWKRPSADLLEQLSPDWIIFDPKLVAPHFSDAISAVPGITKVRSIEDKEGEQRILLHFARSTNRTGGASARQIERVIPDASRVETNQFDLVTLPVVLQPENPKGAVRIGMVVLDKQGSQANVIDVPIVGLSEAGERRYELYFSMAQPGSWLVHFVDPATGRRLNLVPLQVDVRRRDPL